jgi:PmbA protein
MRTDRELARRIIDKALGMGAQMAEVFERSSRVLTAESKDLRTDALETSVGFGYGIRVICNGRLGFAYSTEPERAMDVAASIESAARDLDRRITKIRKASATFGSSETLIMNSRGLEQTLRTTSCSAGIVAIAEYRGEGQMGFGYSSGRFLRQVDFSLTGQEGGMRATELLGASRTKPLKCPIVLGNHIAAQFLSVFSTMLSSENVRKGRSLLKGKIGQQVASPLLDIVDDALMTDAPGLRSIDDEGVPARRNTFVREGVLEGYMYNTHSARKDNVKTTGNAVRGGYAGIPGIGPLSIHMTSRDKSHPKEKLIQMAGCGIYVTSAMGVHTINPVSGEYSIGVSGLMIDAGNTAYPVKEAVLSGNVLDLFKGIQAVGSDLRFYGTVGAPSLLTAPLDLSA